MVITHLGLSENRKSWDKTPECSGLRPRVPLWTSPFPWCPTLLGKATPATPKSSRSDVQLKQLKPWFLGYNFLDPYKID